MLKLHFELVIFIRKSSKRAKESTNYRLFLTFLLQNAMLYYI